MNQLFSKQAPAAIGPYSHAIQSGNLVFCSGQTPLDPVTMKIEVSDIGKQVGRVIENLEQVLAANGLTLKDIIKTTVFLTDMEDFAAMNSVYATYFGDHRPARTTVAVKGLPLGALVEMECIAEYKN
jgi:2-iminobutanoate/2-iminopropanoate deaminase